MPSIMPTPKLHDLHLLLPFALPSAADAATALHTLARPALDRLLARTTVEERVIGEDFQRTLPHERWIARQFGVVNDSSNTSSRQAADEAPLAPYMLLADGGSPGDATWACIEPVHVRIARDHLVLIDPATLGVENEEARTLFDVVKPLIEDLGLTIQAPRPVRWYVTGVCLGTLAGDARRGERGSTNAVRCRQATDRRPWPDDPGAATGAPVRHARKPRHASRG
ncbi:hypothetical protein ACRXB1_33290, partial [Caballeronia sp. M23-90]